MTSGGQPGQAEMLPRRTVYGDYERIVEPGRHVYRTWISAARWVEVLLYAGATAVPICLGFYLWATLPREALVTTFVCLNWSMGLGLLVATLWKLLRNTIVEITPEHISTKQKQFFHWVETNDCDLSGFVAAVLEPVVRVTRWPRYYVPEYMPTLFLESTLGMLSVNALTAAWLSPTRPANATGTTAAFSMGESFWPGPTGEELVRDINRSVKLAREASEVFRAGATISGTDTNNLAGAPGPAPYGRPRPGPHAEHAPTGDHTGAGSAGRGVMRPATGDGSTTAESGTSADDWAGSSRRRWNLSLRGTLAVVLASVVGFLVLLINLDADDRGDKLKKALARKLTYSRDVWRACQTPDAAKKADDPGVYYGHFRSDIRVNFVDVPPRRWWQRLTPSQPFTGTVSVYARNASFDCDLRVAFTAQIAWPEGDYAFSDTRIVNVISNPVGERLVY